MLNITPLYMCNGNPIARTIMRNDDLCNKKINGDIDTSPDIK